MLKMLNDFINVFTMLFVCFLFGRYIINKRAMIRKVYVCLIIFVFSFLGIFVLPYSMLKIFAFYFMFFIEFKVIYKCSLKNTILSSLLYYFMLLCADVLFMLICSLILKLNGSQLYLIFGNTIVSNFSVGILCFLFSLVFKKIINKLLNINISKRKLMYWIIIFALIILFFVFAFTNSSYTFETYIVLVMVAIILIVLIVSFYQAYKNNELEMKYDKLLEFIKKYEIEIDKQRTIRHETKNQLLMIKSKLIDKDNESNVISYIDEIIKDNNHKINHSEYAKLRYLPSNGLKGLFYFKVDEAIDRKIKVDINIAKNIENSFLFKLNSNTFNQLGKILGIFLDNAIEASSLSKNKVLGIECYLNKNEVNFIISNSYLSVNDKLRSTKGINRGHGLILAKTIINSNSKFNNSTEIDDNLFIQKLSIKK